MDANAKRAVARLERAMKGRASAELELHRSIQAAASHLSMREVAAITGLSVSWIHTLVHRSAV